MAVGEKFWTPEREERCRHLWVDCGYTASAIGAELGTTRNSILSKVHRCGWNGPNSAVTRKARAKPGPGRERRPPGTRVVVARKRAAAPVAVPAPVRAPPEGEIAVAATGFRSEGLRSLLELTTICCRWPIGDPRDPHFGFCGAPVVSGVYCGLHARAAYYPTERRA